MVRNGQSSVVVVLAVVVLGSLLVGPSPVYAAPEGTHGGSSFLRNSVESEYLAEPLDSGEGDAAEEMDIVQPYETDTRDDTVPLKNGDDSAEPQSPSTGPFVDPVPSIEGDSFVSNSPRPEYNPPQPSPGEESLIVLLVYFTDLSNVRTSGNVSTQVFTTLDGYYREVSYNQTWLTGTVAGWFPLSHDVAYLMASVIAGG